jgi:hypothetical protein
MFGGSGLGDTWEWDGSTWTPLLLVTGPSARYAPAMAYDSQRGRCVLFGGAMNNAFLQDTWEWNGSAWAQVASSGPSARCAHGMAFDSARGRTVLFGGENGPVVLGDTWEWDGTTWMQVASTGPGPLTQCGMTFDSHRARVVVFGGTSGGLSGVTPSSWEWDGVTWGQLAALGPSFRSSPAMVFESHRHQALMFGGLNLYQGSLGDTWELGPTVTTATASTYGSGCGSPPLTISALTPPILGTSQDTLIANIPGAFAFMAIGFSATTLGAFPLPIALDFQGMPGCWIWHDAAYTLTSSCSAPSGGTALHSITIPNVPAFIGGHAYLEAWADAPGANAFGAVASNAIDLLLGDV